MQMAIVSFRLPSNAIARLKKLAHVRSLRTGGEVRYSALIREVVEQHLLGPEGLAQQETAQAELES